MVSTPPTSQDNLPDVLFFFGLAGAGKTFCGKLISERMGYFCYDLDVDCTPEMRAAIEEGRPFTEQMRDDFFLIVCERIGQLKAQYPRLIVMQAAYKGKHRAQVAAQHPGTHMVWVDAPDQLIMRRLQARGDAVSAQYASRIRANFEAPSCGPRLVNDVSDPEQIVARFQALFPS